MPRSTPPGATRSSSLAQLSRATVGLALESLACDYRFRDKTRLAVVLKDTARPKMRAVVVQLMARAEPLNA